MSDFMKANLSELILFVLRQKAKFGNEITSEILALTDNQIEIKQATLYSTLKKLEQKRLITSYWEDSKIGGKRHYYLLTDLGKEELKNIHFDKPKHQPTLNNDKIDIFDPTLATTKETFWHRNNNFNTSASPLSQLKPTLEVIQEDCVENKDFYEYQITENDDSKVENETKKEATIKINTNDATLIPEQQRTASNDIISNTINQQSRVQIRNTEIDYRNILGELYISEEKKESPVLHDETIIKDELNVVKEEVIPPSPIIQNIEQYAIAKNLNFDNFGIRVKKHSKVSDLDTSSDKYLKKNSLNFFISLIWYIILGIGVLSSYLIVSNTISNDINYLYTLIGVGFISVLIPLYFGILFIANPHKKIRNNFHFKQSFLLTLLVCVIFIVFVIAINLLAGMNNINQIHYLFYWLIPVIIAITTALTPCIKKLLIMTKMFNA